jgi:plastocyanin
MVAVAGMPPGMRSLRTSLGLLVALAAIATLPAAASATAPAEGCTQDNVGVPAGEPTEWTCYASPVTVAGYEVKRGTLAGIPHPAGASGYITHMDVDLYDANGPVPISRLMLHHIVFLDANKTDSACGGPERFYGAGEERMKMTLPEGYGYSYGAADTWATVYMFMNHRAQTDSAFIRYRITVDPDTNIRPVRPYWLDAGDCQYDPIYNVPGIDKPAVPDCSKAKKAAKRKGTHEARKKVSRCRRSANRIEATIPKDASYVKTKDVTVKQDGWLVFGAGHVHGGAKALTLSKPSCGDMEVARSTPTWGNADHPFYNVKPVLHEPGPIGMSSFSSPTGIPLKQGQTLRLNSIYDDLQPHTRVMGIFITYLAPVRAGDPPVTQCGGAPPDTTIGPGTNESGRTTPVPFTVPLTGIDQTGTAVSIDGPPGAFQTLANGDTVTVGDRFFSAPNVRVTPGTTLNYRFNSNELHNLTLANGPQGIGSPDNSSGGVYSQTFTRPGTYRFFCGLHPVQMTERVVVENPKHKKKKKKRKAKRGKP